MDDGINFTTNNASQAVEEKYHGCSVIPLSQLEVNKTGVENGDITSFSASFFVSTCYVTFVVARTFSVLLKVANEKYLWRTS